MRQKTVSIIACWGISTNGANFLGQVRIHSMPKRNSSSVNVRTGTNREGPGLLSGRAPLSPADHAARSTSKAARLRASLLNSTAMRWIGWPRCRYLSA